MIFSHIFVCCIVSGTPQHLVDHFAACCSARCLTGCYSQSNDTSQEDMQPNERKLLFLVGGEAVSKGASKQEGSGFKPGGRLSLVAYACSICACVGFLSVLLLPPTV